MLRPQIVIWASSQTDYTIAPWIGKPLLLAPSYRWFTPLEAYGLSAPEMNYLFNVRDSWAAGTLAYAGTAASEWWAQQTFTSTMTLTALGSGGFYVFPGASTQDKLVRWDSYTGRWIALVIVQTSATGPTCQICAKQSVDGRTWSNLGSGTNGEIYSTTSLSFDTAGLVVSSLDGTVLQMGTDNTGSGASWAVLPSLSATWTAVTTPPSGFNKINGLMGGTFFNGIFSVWQNRTGSLAQFAYSTTSAGLVFTMTSSTIPPAFGESASPLLHAKSAAQILVFSPNTTDTQYLASTDGKAWTARALPLTGMACTGVCYCASTGFFYALFYSAPTTYVLSSSDGVNWNLINALNHQLQGMEESAGEVIVGATVATGMVRVLSSVDGCTTFQLCAAAPAALPGLTAFSGSGQGFLFCDGTNWMPSVRRGSGVTLGF